MFDIFNSLGKRYNFEIIQVTVVFNIKDAHCKTPGHSTLRHLAEKSIMLVSALALSSEPKHFQDTTKQSAATSDIHMRLALCC